jgi:hypothetical protein
MLLLLLLVLIYLWMEVMAMPPQFEKEIQKDILLRFNDVYSVAPISIQGKAYCLAGSGKIGDPCVIIGEERRMYFILDGLHGRIVDFSPVEGCSGAFLAIRHNKQDSSSDAELIYVQIIPENNEGHLKCNIVKIASVPFASKVCSIRTPEGYKAIVSTLNGTLFEIGVSLEITAVPNPLLVGLKRCNDLCLIEDPPGQTMIVVSAQSGLFSLTLQQKSVWMIQKVSDKSTNALCFIDSSDQRERKLLAVHEDSVFVYSKEEYKWTHIDSIDFENKQIHTMLAWSLRDGTYLVTSGLLGAQSLKFWKISKDSFMHDVQPVGKFDGLGVTQMYLHCVKDVVRIITSSHIANEVSDFKLPPGFVN